MTIESNQVTDSRSNAILDRFCMEILPRIHDKVESLTLQACFLPRVLRVANYLHLRKLVIINLELSMGCHIFNEKSPFIHVLKQQISDLVVTIGDEFLDTLSGKLLTDIYNRIFGQMPRLHTFHFDIVTEYVSMNEQQPKPTPDDIRRTFTERGYHVDCYINYEFYNLGRCHVYSIPFDNERLCHITHGFPGGMFINVRVLQRKLYPYFPPYRTEIKNIQKLSELNVDQIGKIYFKDLGPQIGWSIVFIAEYAGPLFIYIIILYFRPSLICGSTSASKSMHIAAHLSAAY
ncbi:unnamed protein product [Rotaria sp. Silwood1]|nr:unnamed protein product [Rotaria sp. Silwood1]